MQNSKILCSICQKDDMVTDLESGEIICSSCGLVISDKAQETRAEWRAFNQEESNNRTRTGIPISLARHDMGLSTVIGKSDKDASGRGLDTAMRATMERLRTWDFRTQAHTPTDRNLRHAFSQLDIVKDKLGLPDAATEKTAYIYRKAQERGLVRGRTVSSMLAAAIYIACREMGVGKTLKDIAQGTNVRAKSLSQSYRILLTELDIKAPMLDPMRCIAKVANRIHLHERITRQALDIMHQAIRKEASAGKNPMGLAAAVLYISYLNNNNNDTVHNNSKSNESNNNSKRPQSTFAQAAGITDVTLRHTIKDLKNQLPLLN